MQWVWPQAEKAKRYCAGQGGKDGHDTKHDHEWETLAGAIAITAISKRRRERHHTTSLKISANNSPPTDSLRSQGGSSGPNSSVASCTTHRQGYQDQTGQGHSQGSPAQNNSASSCRKGILGLRARHGSICALHSPQHPQYIYTASAAVKKCCSPHQGFLEFLPC